MQEDKESNLCEGTAFGSNLFFGGKAMYWAAKDSN